jgi:hypothetical protein
MAEPLTEDLRRLLDEARAKVLSSNRIWAVPSLTYETHLVFPKGLLLGGTISPYFLMKRVPSQKGYVTPPWTVTAAGASVGSARLLFLESVPDAPETEALKEWIPLLESLAKAGEGLVVVTDDMANQAILSLLLINNSHSAVPCGIVTRGDTPAAKLETLLPKAPARKDGGLFRGAAKGTTQKMLEIEREALPRSELVWIRKDASVAFPTSANHDWDDLLIEVAIISVSGSDIEDLNHRFEMVSQEIATWT